MLNNLIKMFSILFGIVAVVSFFAIFAPNNQADTVELGVINTPTASVVLENLVMNHSEISNGYESTYGECIAD